MTTVEIMLNLPEKLAEEARQLDMLSSEFIAELLQAEIERRRIEDEEEAAWEEAVLTRTLGDALNPDGSIDFDKLRQRGKITTLEELYPEGTEDDEA
ncbi:MAG: hypothetical protein U0694_18595 [Anaerolineae bacterium]